MHWKVMSSQCASNNPAQDRCDRADRRGGASGFSLIEVLVAFVVASVMALTFIASQQSAFDMAERYATSWERMNFVATFFAEREKPSLEPTGDAWIPYPDRELTQWQVQVGEDLKVPGYERRRLQGEDLKVPGYERRRLQGEDDWLPPIIRPVTLRASVRGEATEWGWYLVEER
ncbi:MAG: prepilin-type N-terminal cleavage/methylation domain-containing protein [Desulfovibrionaceae bacterium]